MCWRWTGARWSAASSCAPPTRPDSRAMQTPSKLLAGRPALVTGAAQGIGFAIARILAAHGAPVAIVDLQRDAGEAAAQSLRDQGAEAVFIEADVSEEDSIRRLIETAAARLG